MGTSSGKITSPGITDMANNRNNNRLPEPRVIDLTESFTADNNHLNDMVNSLPAAEDNHLNIVINLDTDESFREENIVRPRRRRAPKRRHSNTRPVEPGLAIVDLCTPEPKNKRKQPKRKPINKNLQEEPQEKKAKLGLGSCPICFEDFAAGQQLSVTKCGHVFCHTCIKTALTKRNTQHQCPLCRTLLKGQCQYHPLYLP